MGQRIDGRVGKEEGRQERGAKEEGMDIYRNMCAAIL